MLWPKLCILWGSIIRLPTFWSTSDSLKCCLLSSLNRCFNLPQTITPAITAWFHCHLNLTSEVCLQKHLYDADKTSADISTQTLKRIILKHAPLKQYTHKISTNFRGEISEETPEKLKLREREKTCTSKSTTFLHVLSCKTIELSLLWIIVWTLWH